MCPVPLQCPLVKASQMPNVFPSSIKRFCIPTTPNESVAQLLRNHTYFFISTLFLSFLLNQLVHTTKIQHGWGEI